MPINDRLFLNPFEKWSKYGRFPWTFIVHLVLVVLVTSQAVLLYRKDVKHVSRTARHFVHLFAKTGTLHEPRSLQDAFRYAINNHFFINNVSIVRYQFPDPDGLDVSITWRSGKMESKRVETESYVKANTSSDQEGYLRTVLPFLYDSELMPQVAMIRIRHSLSEYGYIKHTHAHGCLYNWNLVTIFDGEEAGEFLNRVTCMAGDCQEQDWQARLLHVVIFCLAFIGGLLILRKFLRSLGTVRRLRRSAEWDHLSTKDILLLFSPWWVLALVVNCIQIVACVVCLEDQPDIGSRLQSIGFSCFFTWLNMTQYFESFPGYYMVFHTMAKGTGRVLRFLLSVGPLFYGFVLLGMCLFWQSKFFGSQVAATSVLFSLLNGDSLYDAFEDLYSVSGVAGQLYLYIFLFLFTFVILNVNISIITEAYEQAKESQPQGTEGQGREAPQPRCPSEDSFELRRGSSSFMSPRFYGGSVRMQDALATTYRGLREAGGEAPTFSPPREAQANVEMTDFNQTDAAFDHLLRLIGENTEALLQLEPPPSSDHAGAAELARSLGDLLDAVRKVGASRERWPDSALGHSS